MATLSRSSHPYRSGTNRDDERRSKAASSHRMSTVIPPKVMADALQEYQSQLADVVDLLKESPDDESLLSLKADLEELIAITRQQSAGIDEVATVDHEAQVPVQEQHVSVAAAIDAAADRALASARGETEDFDDNKNDNKRGIEQIAAVAAQAPPNKKVSKKAAVDKEFVVPSGLVVLETDTDAEKNRKYRAIKSLKNKWREKKKEAESSQKQKSWQSFQKKKKSTIKEKSMFSTAEGDTTTKVGVVSAGSRQLTHGGERKRHDKYS